MGNTYVNQSVQGLAIVEDDTFTALAYFVVAFSGSVLIHSFWINYRKSLTAVTITTNIAAAFLLMQGVFFLQCVDDCSPRESVAFLNLLANGMCGKYNFMTHLFGTLKF